MKINRFSLRLVNENGVFADKKTAYERYFSHSSLTKEQEIRYDRDQRCYYFDSMEDAIQARDQLKAYFNNEIQSERMHGYAPMYDVISEMIPWYECDYSRKNLQNLVDAGKGVESAKIPEDMKGIESLLEELENKNSIETKEEGDFEIDVPKSHEAIKLAEIGIGSLKRIVGKTVVSITIEEAKQVVHHDPDSIILVMDDPF